MLHVPMSQADFYSAHFVFYPFQLHGVSCIQPCLRPPHTLLRPLCRAPDAAVGAASGAWRERGFAACRLRAGMFLCILLITPLFFARVLVTLSLSVSTLSSITTFSRKRLYLYVVGDVLRFTEVFLLRPAGALVVASIRKSFFPALVGADMHIFEATKAG